MASQFISDHRRQVPIKTDGGLAQVYCHNFELESQGKVMKNI